MTSTTISKPKQSRIATLARSVMQTLKTWRENHRSRRLLSMIDSRDLGEVGISTGQVDYELRKPFWKAPGHLR